MTMLFFPEHRLRFIRIPKNACSTVINSLGRARVLDNHPHDTSIDFTICPEDADNWPVVAVLRDPYDRIISAYLNKFVDLLPEELFVHELIDYTWRTSRRMQRPHIGRSITFREFINHLYWSPDEHLDQHWRSQSSFLMAKPTIILNMDTLHEDWLATPSLRDIPLHTFAPHATKSNLEAGANVLDVDAENFAGFKAICGAFPSRDKFRDPTLVDLMKTRFSDDYALLEASFGTTKLPSIYDVA